MIAEQNRRLEEEMKTDNAPEQAPGIMEQVSESLKVLNCHYGKGDVGNIILYLDGRIEFWQKPYYGPGVRRIGWLRNGTVYALRHQRKLGKEIGK
jgi:hypothetical protein